MSAHDEHRLPEHIGPSGYREHTRAMAGGSATALRPGSRSPYLIALFCIFAAICMIMLLRESVARWAPWLKIKRAADVRKEETQIIAAAVQLNHQLLMYADVPTPSKGSRRNSVDAKNIDAAVEPEASLATPPTGELDECKVTTTAKGSLSNPEQLSSPRSSRSPRSDSGRVRPGTPLASPSSAPRLSSATPKRRPSLLGRASLSSPSGAASTVTLAAGTMLMARERFRADAEVARAMMAADHATLPDAPEEQEEGVETLLADELVNQPGQSAESAADREARLLNLAEARVPVSRMQQVLAVLDVQNAAASPGKSVESQAESHRAALCTLRSAAAKVLSERLAAAAMGSARSADPQCALWEAHLRQLSAPLPAASEQGPRSAALSAADWLLVNSLKRGRQTATIRVIDAAIFDLPLMCALRMDAAERMQHVQDELRLLQRGISGSSASAITAVPHRTALPVLSPLKECKPERSSSGSIMTPVARAPLPPLIIS